MKSFFPLFVAIGLFGGTALGIDLDLSMNPVVSSISVNGKSVIGFEAWHASGSCTNWYYIPGQFLAQGNPVTGPVVATGTVVYGDTPKAYSTVQTLMDFNVSAVNSGANLDSLRRAIVAWAGNKKADQIAAAANPNSVADQDPCNVFPDATASNVSLMPANVSLPNQSLLGDSKGFQPEPVNTFQALAVPQGFEVGHYFNSEDISKVSLVVETNSANMKRTLTQTFASSQTSPTSLGSVNLTLDGYLTYLDASISYGDDTTANYHSFLLPPECSSNKADYQFSEAIGLPTGPGLSTKTQTCATKLTTVLNSMNDKKHLFFNSGTTQWTNPVTNKPWMVQVCDSTGKTCQNMRLQSYVTNSLLFWFFQQNLNFDKNNDGTTYLTPTNETGQNGNVKITFSSIVSLLGGVYGQMVISIPIMLEDGDPTKLDLSDFDQDWVRNFEATFVQSARYTRNRYLGAADLAQSANFFYPTVLEDSCFVSFGATNACKPSGLATP